MIKMVRIKMGILGDDGGGGGSSAGSSDAGGGDGIGDPNAGASDAGSAYDYSKMVGESGKFSDNWRDGLNPELKEDKTIAALSDVNQMAKMLVHSQKLIGKNTVAMINENSTDEEKNEFYTKMGRPESADKFDINMEKVSPDFKELVEGDLGWYKDFAFKHGLSQKAAQEMFNDFQEHNSSKFSEQMEAHKGQMDEKFNSLMSNWGNDADKNLQAADNMLNLIGMSDEIVSAGLQKNDVVINLLHKMSELVSEDKLSTGGEGNLKQGVQEQINSIMDDKSSPYWNGKHPRHKEFVTKVNVLYSKLD